MQNLSNEYVSSQTKQSDEDISPDVVRVIPELRDLVGDFVGDEDLGDLPAVLIVHLLVAVPGQVQGLEICNGLQVAAELSKEGYLMTNCFCFNLKSFIQSLRLSRKGISYLRCALRLK